MGSIMNARIVIHSLAHARAALVAATELDLPVTLTSAPGAAAYLGAPVFREMVAAAEREFPDADVTALLDCGDDAGLALNALRHGLKVIRLKAADPVLARVADIAGQLGATLDPTPDAPALDLLEAADPRQACRDWLRATPTAA